MSFHTCTTAPALDIFSQSNRHGFGDVGSGWGCFKRSGMHPELQTLVGILAEQGLAYGLGSTCFRVFRRVTVLEEGLKPFGSSGMRSLDPTKPTLSVLYSSWVRFTFLTFRIRVSCIGSCRTLARAYLPRSDAFPWPLGFEAFKVWVYGLWLKNAKRAQVKQ